MTPYIKAEAKGERLPGDSWESQRVTVQVWIYTTSLRRPAVTGNAIAYVDDADGFWTTDPCGGWDDSLHKWAGEDPQKRSALRRVIIRAAERAEGTTA